MKISQLSGLFICTALIFCTPEVWPQNYQGLSHIYRDLFLQIFGADERLVSGTLYPGPANGSIEGHPYFLEENWNPGSIEIGDIRFDDLLLNYDVAINLVILQCSTADRQNVQVGLRSGHITRVIIGDHIFVPLPFSADSTRITYAELMTDGAVRYLITRKKNIIVSYKTGFYDFAYKQTISHYLWYNDRLIPFINKKILFELFPEFKTQMIQYARKNRLMLGRTKPGNRALWIEYCNHLIDSSM